MDQFAIGMSKENHAILLDCATLEYHYAPLELGDNVILIMNTNKRRDLVTSKYNERCAECAKGLELINNGYKEVKHLCELEVSELEEISKVVTDEVVYSRVRHVVSEMDRVKKTFVALQANDIELVGKFINESHRSLKEDYEVTGKELDTIVALAQAEEGVLGARMIGAGFAGCAIAIVKKDAVERVKANVLAGYEKEIGYIQKEFSLFTPRFLVYVNGWTVEGDFFGWEYKIKNGINTVATISKELFNFTDTYTIVVKEENALEALLVVLAIDAVKCSKNK
jgi:galactokinase